LSNKYYWVAGIQAAEMREPSSSRDSDDKLRKFVVEKPEE